MTGCAGTKTEIKLKKAESGSWAKLDIPRRMEQDQQSSRDQQQQEDLARAENQVKADSVSDPVPSRSVKNWSTVSV